MARQFFFWMCDNTHYLKVVGTSFGIHEMLNVIILISSISIFVSNISPVLGYRTNNNFGAGVNEIVFR